MKRILIIDDDDDIREIVKVALETTAGWEVRLAASAREGLDLAAAEHPDAIVLDVSMPEMDGPTAFQHLQLSGRTHDIPVIFLTAKVQASDQRRFAELGATAFIPKPFDPLQLANQVAEALGWTS